MQKQHLGAVIADHETGDEAPAIGTVLVEEAINVGTRAYFTVSESGAMVARPGRKVRLGLPVESGDPGEFQLLVTRTSHAGGQDPCTHVEAQDPFSATSEFSEFRSRLGACSLEDLIAEMARELYGTAWQMDCASGTSWIDRPYLLQANEPMFDFVRRHASAVGNVVYWDRTGMRIEDLHATSHRQPFRVESARPLRMATYRARTLRNRVAQSFDPSSGRIDRVDISAGHCGSKSRQLLDRIAAAGAVPQPDALELDKLEFVSALESPRLGQPIARGDDRGIVTSIVHRVQSNGFYERSATVTRTTTIWGSTRPSPLGLLSAEVVANDDPTGVNRIRVRLLEDSEQRNTDWIPVSGAGGASSSEIRWLPEVGDLVLVHSDPDMPESMHCLGSFRNPAGPRSTPYNDREKSIVFDEGAAIEWSGDRKSIRIRCGSSWIDLSPGGIQIQVSSGDVRIDGEKIFLG